MSWLSWGLTGELASAPAFLLFFSMRNSVIYIFPSAETILYTNPILEDYCKGSQALTQRLGQLSISNGLGQNMDRSLKKMSITYRPAQIDDCPLLAEYIQNASDGILDVLFADNAAGLTVGQILLNGLADKGHDSFKSIIVAEDCLKLVGMIQFYSSSQHRIDQGMESFFSREKLKLFEEFYASRIDNSLLVKAMYVAEGYRRQGIATKFLTLAEEAARSSDYEALSLFVSAGNAPALSLYTAYGFKTSKSIELGGSAFAHKILLLKFELD